MQILASGAEMHEKLEVKNDKVSESIKDEVSEMSEDETDDVNDEDINNRSEELDFEEDNDESSDSKVIQFSKKASFECNICLFFFQ